MPRKTQKKRVIKKKKRVIKKRIRSQTLKTQKTSAKKAKRERLEFSNTDLAISPREDSLEGESMQEELVQFQGFVEQEDPAVHESRELNLEKFLASEKYYLKPLTTENQAPGPEKKDESQSFSKGVASNWLNSLDSLDSKDSKPSSVQIDLKIKKETFLDFLAHLPLDFISFCQRLFKKIVEGCSFFLRLKIKILLILKIIIWSLEALGRAPFIVIGKLFLVFLFFLGIFERILFFLLGKIIESLLTSLRDFYYILRRIYSNLFWIFKNGAKEIINLPSKLISFLKPQPPSGWAQVLVSFVIACFILVLPFEAYIYFLNLKNTQGLVLGAATSAYEHLENAQRATAALVFEQASEEFKKAGLGFTSAKSELDQLNFLISNIIKITPQGTSALKLLACGQAVAEAGEYFSQGLDFLVPEEINSSPLIPNEESDTGLPQFKVEKGGLVLLRENLNLALPKVVFARENIEQVNLESIPEDNQENFITTKKKIIKLEKMMKRLFSFTDIALELLGTEDRKRYLFVFQNDNEIRPTGGFIGSFALLDIYKSQVKNLEIPGGGPYDLRGNLLKKVKPPYPLQVINSQWQMQDANWFPDFPTSAQKIIWFYENSGGPSVDGVIGINSSLIPKLLEITGPIKMEDYDKVIDKDNFQTETQKAVEIEYDRFQNRPKQFIADLAPKILENIFELQGRDLIEVLSIIDLALQERSILFYFTDPEIQTKNETQNWAGGIKQVADGEDFLMVVNTNVNGGKTDGVTSQKISHKSIVNEDGTITNEVEITRAHNGLLGDLFTGKTNIDYLRIYVPSGSIFLGAEGFEPLGPGNFRIIDSYLQEDEDLLNIEGEPLIDEITGTRITNEFGKTVFGNWLLLDPGDVKTCKFRYRLPFSFKLKEEPGLLDKLIREITPEVKTQFYTLYFQKQPGSKKDLFESTLVFPLGLEVAWWYPLDESLARYKNAIKFRTQIDSDKYYGVILKR